MSKPKKDIIQPPQGKFVSNLPDDKIVFYQKRKTIFMLLSTLMFAISLFLPVGGREMVSRHLALNTLYVLFDIVLIGLSVFISYKGSRGQKIAAEVQEKNAPKYGYNKLTFVSYEIFNVLHVLQLVLEVAVGIWLIEVWGIINMAIIAASTAFCVISRQYLFRANRNHMTYFPPFENENPAEDIANNDNANVIEPPTDNNDKID